MGKTNTLKWLLFAATVILVMLGYHFRTQKDTSACSKATLSKAGVIGGIFYSTDRPTAMIGSDIAHEGDILQGVRIVKIYTNKVEFEKNGSKWSQKVQENPNKCWSKRD